MLWLVINVRPVCLSVNDINDVGPKHVLLSVQNILILNRYNRFSAIFIFIDKKKKFDPMVNRYNYNQ
jgi:hypothetical protein